MRISDWSSDVCSSDLERAGLSLSELGVVGGLPFIAAVLVCMVLGRVVDRFTERGHDSIRVQLWIFALTAALMPLGAFITMTSSGAVAIALITIVVVVCQAWFVGYYVLLAGLSSEERRVGEECVSNGCI